MSSSRDTLVQDTTETASMTSARNDGAEEALNKSVEQGTEHIPAAAAAAAATAHMSLPIDDGEFAAAAGPFLQPKSDTTGGEAETDAIQYPELEEQTTLQPPASFKPFFTLVEDPVTGEHHHPTVHYLFADDDPDLLTNAALETLEQKSQSTERRDDSHRIVLVDMGSDGQQVKSTSSLSSEWQGVESSVTQAPSWGNDSLMTTQLMLRISGQGSNSRARGTQAIRPDVHGLIKSLDELQTDLETVIGHTNDDTQ